MGSSKVSLSSKSTLVFTAEYDKTYPQSGVELEVEVSDYSEFGTGTNIAYLYLEPDKVKVLYGMLKEYFGE